MIYFVVKTKTYVASANSALISSQFPVTLLNLTFAPRHSTHLEDSGPKKG